MIAGLQLDKKGCGVQDGVNGFGISSIAGVSRSS
jgi:hypothetical protein